MIVDQRIDRITESRPDRIELQGGVPPSDEIDNPAAVPPPDEQYSPATLRTGIDLQYTHARTELPHRARLTRAEKRARVGMMTGEGVVVTHLQGESGDTPH